MSETPPWIRVVRVARHRDAVVAAKTQGGARGVELVNFDLSQAYDVAWVAQELRELFPSLEHLGLSGTPMSRSVMASMCEAGAFDGLLSVALEGCGMRSPTLEVLLERLETRGEVEHLRFARCQVRRDGLARTCATSLASTLRSLSLPFHPAFDAELAAALASRAPELERLERLDLRHCGVGVEGVVALARAEWSETLGHLALGGVQFGFEGLEALTASGLLGVLMSEDFERTLDLSGQRIGDRGLSLVFDSGVLDGVEHLKLIGCDLTTLEPFYTSRAAAGLCSLELSGRWRQGEGGVAFLEALEGMERLESLAVTTVGLDDFVERLCVSGVGRRLRALELHFSRERGAQDLQALLDWGLLDALERFSATFEVAGDGALIERALETGLFDASESHRGGVVLRAGSHRDSH